VTVTAPKLSRLGRAAVAYATQFGWRVFPLHSVDASGCTCGSPACTGTKPGKHPRTARGCLDASTDAEQIRAWWTQWPDANIGVATGNGLVVIDIDPRHGGDESFDELRERLGKLPDTVEALTGSKGRHIYLAVPKGVEVRNSAGVIAPGIDVRGENGYVVAAPSSHVSGGTYGWELSSRPDEVDVAEIPRAWLDAIARRPKLRVLRGGSDGEAVAEGSRNETLFKRACSMRATGWDEAEILAALLAFNERRCSPPLDPAEVKSIAASAARYEPNAPPRPNPDPTPDGQPAVEQEDTSWHEQLVCNPKGGVRNTFLNVVTIIRNSRDYATLRLNEMTRAPELGGERVTDARFAQVREQIERRWGFAPSAESVVSALGLIASERRYHPVQQYLRSLKWDGTERLDRVAADVLGADATPINVTMVRSWFVSAVARAMQPGCKVDTSLVLVGAQGVGKSSFFRVLGGEWFSDSAVDIESKDAMLQINAAWIYELGELEHVTSRAHAGRVKAFVSSQVDTYRQPYGRVVESVPRHNVIVGTTNEAQFLTDSTGDRRFWVVRVARVDTEALARDRDQLWAEALAALDAREGWWLVAEAEVARAEATEAHRVADAWEDTVATWLEGLTGAESRDITTQRVLTSALRVDLDRITPRESARVSTILRRLGYLTRVLRVDGRNTRVWDCQTADGAWRHRP
jgi:predicted P-loop ATPase